MRQQSSWAPERARVRGRLSPAELAEGAVLADLAVGLTLFGILLPFAGFLQALAITPFAVLTARRRTRAVAVACVAAAAVSFLVGGAGLVFQVLVEAGIGWAVGVGAKRSWSVVRTVGLALVTTGAGMAVTSTAAMAVLSPFRHLSLEEISVEWTGLSRLARAVGLTGLARSGSLVVAWSLQHWWVFVPASEVAGVAGATLLAHYLSVPLITRLNAASQVGPARPGPAAPAGRGQPRASAGPAASGPAASTGVGALPARLRSVSYHYPGSSSDALSSIDLDIPLGCLVAVIGNNGSGKSTLGKLLAGMAPTSGTIERPGEIGLGQVGGTALVSQRPESQVLGARVIDDLTWGLPLGYAIDSDALLEEVGMRGFAGRETSTLSGGELQRLAIAAALARKPALLISDESTSMLDPDGRSELASLLRRLPAMEGTTVVHVTHSPEEVAGAGIVAALDHGRLSLGRELPARCAARPQAGSNGSNGSDRPAGTDDPRGSARSQGRRARERARRRASRSALRLQGVGHVYDPGTPWSHRALEGIDLEIDSGEAVVVVGRNGSGKSTFSWVLAGLLSPSEGTATLGDEPLASGRGRVGIAFQHARLQLFRPTVRADVRYGTTCSRAEADAALELVGLDPARFGDRSVDELSGGEVRRVALAGLLARRVEVLVLDEPLAGLDGPSVQALVDVLEHLRSARAITTIVVSHDLLSAPALAERVVELDAGRIVSDRAFRGDLAATLAGSGRGHASRWLGERR
ncbi:MAG: ABC transporter ATP-binding protein [Acidimicrobiales bacterium]